MLSEQCQEISSNLKNLKSHQVIKKCINNLFLKRIAYVCSFGAESAVLLHMISRIDKNLPIIFINTLKLFDETLEYKKLITNRFKLQNIIEITPQKNDIEKEDLKGNLWSKNPNKCCNLRKVKILDKALHKFQAWFSGRKAYQSEQRSKNKIVETQDNKFIISPLIWWTEKDIKDYYLKYELPRHPLFHNGYLSIGCKHCTSKSYDVLDKRSGRWIGLDKTECGIYKSNNNIK